MTIYKPKNFPLHELLPRWHYNRWHNDPRVWLIWPGGALAQLQMLRERYGPATVNDWNYEGGLLQYCGYRPLNCKVGAKWSLHKWGLAFDMHFRDVPADEVRADILAHQGASWCRYIHAIEMGTTHLHWDMRNRVPVDGSRILQIQP